MSVLTLGQYFGRSPERWTADSLVLSPVIHDQPRANVAHAHEAAFVALMLDGDYAENAALRSFRFDRFTALYHPPGLEHQDFVGPRGVRLLLFEFRPELLDGAEFRRADSRSLRDLSGSRAAWELLSLYREAKADLDPIEFESRAMELVGRIVPLSRAPRDLPSLGRAREYLHSHFRERVRMSRVAAAAGVHPVYLGQMFRRELGETIGSYVTRLRVRAAAEQLVATGAAYASIALDHGFCDQSHFQRAFKRLSGVTPAAFRREMGRAADLTRE
jgi:AraC family transcriptional regulator